MNFFTDGLRGHKEAPKESIEQGLVDGTIYAIGLADGKLKWKIDTEFPPRVSPLVSNGIVYTGIIEFGDKERNGIVLALDKDTGQKLWEYDVNASISPVGVLSVTACYSYQQKRSTCLTTMSRKLEDR